MTSEESLTTQVQTLLQAGSRDTLFLTQCCIEDYLMSSLYGVAEAEKVLGELKSRLNVPASVDLHAEMMNLIDACISRLTKPVIDGGV